MQKHVFSAGEEISNPLRLPRAHRNKKRRKLHIQPETVIVVVKLILKLSKRSLKAQHKTQSERDLQKKATNLFPT